MKTAAFLAATCTAVLLEASTTLAQTDTATAQSALVVESLELVPVRGRSGTFEVYGAIANGSTREVRLVSVGGPGVVAVADVVGRHGPSPALPSFGPPVVVPPNAELLFLERGRHLVAFTDGSDDASGSDVLELAFDDGTTRSFDAPVLPAGAAPTDHHHEP